MVSPPSFQELPPPLSQNLISAMEDPDAVIKFIEAELAECRISQITAGELSATRGIHQGQSQKRGDPTDGDSSWTCRRLEDAA